MSSALHRPLDRCVVVTALGIGQILAWGTSFYFPAVFAETIVAETGWSLGYVVAGTSLGLLVAGLISPQVGRIIDKRGGRPVLLASSLCYAAGLAGIGAAPALVAATLGLAALASLALVLSVSTSRRRRDLALLKAMGFTKRDVSTAVAWQATVTIGVGLLVGMWQGYWVAYIGIPAFIVTLAGMLLFRGLDLMILDAQSIPVPEAFQKIAVLHPLAPNGSEPPFLVAQTIVLLTFLWLGFGAVRKFHPEAMAPARR